MVEFSGKQKKQTLFAIPSTEHSLTKTLKAIRCILTSSVIFAWAVKAIVFFCKVTRNFFSPYRADK